jgi:glycosyltransferase involved in cell wall biosynthesis
MPQGLISVVLPVYNGESYIASAIRSLLDQTVDCEIFVSDDCSTDNTREIVRAIRAPQLVLIESREQGGAYVNFNRAIRASSGQYIQLFSHDDIAHPGFLASQIASFDQNPAIGLTYASCNVIDEHGLLLGKADDDDTPCVIDFKTYLALSSLYGNLSPSVSCMMMKREVVQTVGLFNERYALAGDLEFCNRVAERFCIARNRSLLLDIRDHRGSLTLNRSSPLKYIAEEVDLLPFYRRHLGDADYKLMIHRRTKGRGAGHAKHIIRAFLAGRLGEARTAYRELSKVHNAPLCILHGLSQALGDRFRRLLPARCDS